ncbi:hypothetical protein HYV10_01635 [Candidatus Dependentiae bacterium]|nr:hypothetical protein [Candidatus Dependentiae bacterium]
MKKALLILLCSSKIFTAQADSENCLTCYAGTCCMGCSTIVTTMLPPDFCIEASFVASSLLACQIGKHCHEKCTYNFDSNKQFDSVCSNIAGLIAAKYFVDCAIFVECPNCLPFATLILLHNGLKIAEEKLQNFLQESENQHENTKKN